MLGNFEKKNRITYKTLFHQTPYQYRIDLLILIIYVPDLCTRGCQRVKNKDKTIKQHRDCTYVHSFTNFVHDRQRLHDR